LYESLARDPQSRSWFFLALYEILLRWLPSYGQLNSDRLTIPSVTHGQEERTHNLKGSLTLAYSLPPDLIMNWFRWCLTTDYDVDRAVWCNGSNSSPGVIADGRLWAEQALLGLPPQCIDLNEAVRLCWQHRLFKAYLHLYTDILFDFETPFRNLINFLMSPNQHKSQGSENPETYCQTLLLLLRNALAGESYSQQSLPSPMDVDIFNLLLNEAMPDEAPRRNRQSQPKYPRLWLLLNHCATDFLNLLMISISADRFFTDGDLGLSHRTHLYHKLIACALDEYWSATSSESTNVCIPVLEFLVHQLSQSGNESIRLEDNKLFQLFEHICRGLEQSSALTVTDTLEASVIDLIETGRFTQLDVCLCLAKTTKL
uniref:Vps8 domain-containing protein n=1 Tax=Echinostoma caproni TaxID=27848 RepID=A0A183AL22_9TREM